MLSLQQKSLLTLGSIILVIIGYLIFTFFLDQGTVVITSVPPFSIESKGISQVCSEKSCTFKLYPHDYTFTFKKENYFDETKIITVKRWQTQKVDLNFRLIPTIGEYAKYNPLPLPAKQKPYIDNLRNISFFLPSKKGTLKNFPPEISSVEFSPHGSYALIVNSSDLFLYNVKDETFKQLPILSLSVFDWMADESGFIFLNQRNRGIKNELNLFNVNSFKITKITSFTQGIANPAISVSPDGKFIILYLPNHKDQSIYLIDTVKKFKKKISLGRFVENINWSPDNAKILISGPNQPVSIYDLETRTLKNTSIIAPLELIVWRNSQTLVFATKQNFQPISQTDNGEIPVQIIKEIINSKELLKTLFINFDIKTNGYRYLIIPEKTALFEPDRLETDEKGNIYFRSGEKIYLIPLAEKVKREN